MKLNFTILSLMRWSPIRARWSAWLDAAIIDREGRGLAPVQCKSASDAWPAGTVAAGADPFPMDHSSAIPSLVGSTAVAASDKAPVPLRTLFKSYGKEAQLSHATVKRWSPVVDRLIGHLGHDDAAAITRADIVAWKDTLLESGMKNITVRDVYLAATKALLKFAVDQGLLAESPAKEVKVRVRKKVKEREKGFDGIEAAQILRGHARAVTERRSSVHPGAPGPANSSAHRDRRRAARRSARVRNNRDGNDTGCTANR